MFELTPQAARLQRKDAPALEGPRGSRQVMKKELRSMGYAEGANALSPSGGSPGVTTALVNMFKGTIDGIRAKIDQIKSSLGMQMSPEERAAAEYVRGMLEPGKLGGVDRTFNFADLDAVVAALMQDTAGLSAEVQEKLRGEGSDYQADLVKQAFEGKWGILTGVAKKKVLKEAPVEIKGELGKGLEEGGISPATGKKPDGSARQITFAELREFEKNAAVLQAMQARITERFGIAVTFPGGLSQSAMDHQLEGRFGLPAGARIGLPKPKPQE